MKRAKLYIVIFGGIAVSILGVVFCYLFWVYSNHDDGSLNDKYEWSVLQASYEEMRNVKSVDCKARFFESRGLRSAVMWYGSEPSAILLNPPSNSSAIKIMPEGARFFLSDEDLLKIEKRGASSSLVKFLKSNRATSCQQR